MNHSANQQKSTLPPQKRSFRKKRWLIGAVIVVILFFGGLVSAWFIASRMRSSPATSTKNDQTAATKRNDKVNQTVSQAKQEASQGSVDKAKATYDSAIKNTSDSVEKSQLLFNKAMFLYNGNDQAGALSAAIEADTAQSSLATADFLAQLYQMKGDKQNAIVYYKKALSMVDSSSPQADQDSKRYQAIIAALSGSKG